MKDIIVNFLKEKGISQDIINQIVSHLEGVTNTEQLKSILEQFRDKLPEGIMDHLPHLSTTGSFMDKVKTLISNIFGK